MKPFIVGAALLASAWGGYRLTRAAGPADAEGPVVVVAHVDVMPQFTAPGRDLLRQFAADARRDPGALRVDVFEEIGRPNHSTVVATWADRRAYDDHVANERTRAHRARLQPMLGSPFDERLHRISAP